MEAPLLEVQDLKIYYKTPTVPVRAIDGVSFTVNGKEILGLAGESGCGKSTLASGILKLISPPTYIAGGKVLFRGSDLYAMSDEELRKIRWKHIAISPQSSMNALNPVMKIYNQIADAIETHEGRKPKKDLKNHISTLLKGVALSPRVSDEYACELSGGMKQRVIICMGMALEPELIVADEPTSSLDVVVQRGVLELLVDLKEKQGTSVLLVSHDIAILAEIVDRLAIIYAGKIVEIQGVFDIFNEPLHPYTRGLIDSVPSFKKKEIPRSIPGLPPDLKNPPAGCRFHPRCPKAMEICKEKEPEFREIGRGKFVACHLYL
jgi:peptide/nickel transport system ATP-binding protein